MPGSWRTGSDTRKPSRARGLRIQVALSSPRGLGASRLHTASKVSRSEERRIGRDAVYWVPEVRRFRLAMFMLIVRAARSLQKSAKRMPTPLPWLSADSDRTLMYPIRGRSFGAYQDGSVFREITLVSMQLPLIHTAISPFPRLSHAKYGMNVTRSR